MKDPTVVRIRTNPGGESLKLLQPAPIASGEFETARRAAGAHGDHRKRWSPAVVEALVLLWEASDLTHRRLQRQPARNSRSVLCGTNTRI
jgi:hypothetical protein